MVASRRELEHRLWYLENKDTVTQYLVEYDAMETDYQATILSNQGLVRLRNPKTGFYSDVKWNDFVDILNDKIAAHWRLNYKDKNTVKEGV